VSLASEFKEFAIKGNVVDMAVGLVIGAAFGKIVSSLVADVIMPPLGLIIGRVSFNKLAVQIGLSPQGKPVMLEYGLFIQTIFDFVLIALAIFFVVKLINRLKRAPAPAPAVVPPPTKSEELLGEIRDLLAKR
jgi:large conductance mechanosensitive channel